MITRLAALAVLLATGLGGCASEPALDDPYGYPPSPGATGYGYYDDGPRPYGYRAYPYYYGPYGPIRRDPPPQAQPPQRQQEKKSEQPSRYIERGRDGSGQSGASMKVQPPPRRTGPSDDDKKRQ